MALEHPSTHWLKLQRVSVKSPHRKWLQVQTNWSRFSGHFFHSMDDEMLEPDDVSKHESCQSNVLKDTFIEASDLSVKPSHDSHKHFLLYAVLFTAHTAQHNHYLLFLVHFCSLLCLGQRSTHSEVERIRTHVKVRTVPHFAADQGSFICSAPEFS